MTKTQCLMHGHTSIDIMLAWASQAAWLCLLTDVISGRLKPVTQTIMAASEVTKQIRASLITTDE